MCGAGRGKKGSKLMTYLEIKDDTNTLNVNMDDVVVVLDAVLNLTPIHSCVSGMQITYLDASICWGLRVAQQVNSVQVALADVHLSLQSHQDGRDLFFGDKAPFNAMRTGSNGGSSRIWDGVVLRWKKQYFYRV